MEHAPIPATPTDSAASPSSTSAPRAARDPRKAEFEANKLTKRLQRQVGEAIADFAMIEPGDHVMVCLSGGKDSYGLLDILLALQKRAPIPFTLVAVNLDQKQPGFPEHVLPEYLESRGIDFRIAEQDTYSVVKRLVPEGATMCSLCSRLRRGVLYRVARELGATRIALGHHRDDLMATFFLNLFFGGKLKTMPPKLVSDNGEHVVIRPLAYVRERDLAAYATLKQFPLIPCSLCGSQENLQRKQIGIMLRDWEKKHPGRLDSIFHALGRVEHTHLLDRTLQDFAAIRATGTPDAGGDIAFDVDPALEAAADAVAEPPLQGIKIDHPATRPDAHHPRP
ncbi:MAG: tRNA 2-thiocytidine(32) synthetase TtcA [Burkholderiales bacterium]|nr:tRNA 2-thiocytidine(32) synthetase TtcA [Burkholderiales bacterium]